MKSFGVFLLCFLLFACGQQPMERAVLDLPTAQPVSAIDQVVATSAFTEITIVRQLDQYRITHTWQRRGDTWQIITGMSGAEPSK